MQTTNLAVNFDIRHRRHLVHSPSGVNLVPVRPVQAALHQRINLYGSHQPCPSATPYNRSSCDTKSFVTRTPRSLSPSGSGNVAPSCRLTHPASRSTHSPSRVVPFLSPSLYHRYQPRAPNCPRAQVIPSLFPSPFFPFSLSTVHHI